jgi:hypothetical protein
MGNTSTTSDYDRVDEIARQIFGLFKTVFNFDQSDVMGDLPLTAPAFRELMTTLDLEDFEARQLQPLTAESVFTALTISPSDDEDISTEVRDQRQFALQQFYMAPASILAIMNKEHADTTIITRAIKASLRKVSEVRRRFHIVTYPTM